MINSVFMLANKAGYALGGVVIGLCFVFMEYKPNLPEYSKAALTGILLIFLGIPIISRIIVSGLMFFHKFSHSAFQEIVGELKKRKVFESIES